ncbi:MAG: hypothetical protein K9W44_08430 [Candidatus Lokiarchaeota archaeon]|nr:hypothetical protein [Candidatus Harpocratesius repetitus]
MKYKIGIIITIIGLGASLLFYSVAPVITYLFGTYMFLFIIFLYFTDIRGSYRTIQLTKASTQNLR